MGSGPAVQVSALAVLLLTLLRLLAERVMMWLRVSSELMRSWSDWRRAHRRGPRMGSPRQLPLTPSLEPPLLRQSQWSSVRLTVRPAS